MDIKSLKAQIKSNKLLPMYIFSGKDLGLMNLYISKMGSTVRADSVSSIWNKLTSRSLLPQSENAVYVVRDDKEFMQKEKVWMNANKSIKNGTLILIVSTLDKRSKFIKQFEDIVVEFNHMTTAQLKNAFKGCLKQNQLEELAEACNNDYTQMSNEIDKIRRLNYSEFTLNAKWDEIMNEVVNVKPQIDAFSFMGSLANKKSNSIRKLQFLLKEGESGIMLLGLMYTNFRNAALVLGYLDLDTKDISERTGLNGWQISSLKGGICHHYSGSEILKCLRIIQDREIGIKTGLYEEKFAIESAVVNILAL